MSILSDYETYVVVNKFPKNKYLNLYFRFHDEMQQNWKA